MRKFLSLLVVLMTTVVTAFADTTPDYLCFTAEEAGTKVGFHKYNTSWTPSAVIYYQIVANGTSSEWADYTFDSNITLTNAGDKVYFKAADKNEKFSESIYNYFTFTADKKVAASGNIMSLLDATCQQTSVPQYAFLSLFYGCSNLTSAPALPATTMASYCYYNMFCECTSLMTAPALPAKTLANDCYCCMFEGCTSLVNAPKLPATKLQSNCYLAMFKNCTALEESPELPATSLETGCYKQLFYGCSKLNKVSVKFTDWLNQSYSTDYWLYGVATTGTFNCLSLLDATKTGESYVPAAWTVNKEKVTLYLSVADIPNQLVGKILKLNVTQSSNVEGLTPSVPLMYSTTNTNVATIDADGNIKTVGPGVCTLEAYSNADGPYTMASATTTITVLEDPDYLCFTAEEATTVKFKKFNEPSILPSLLYSTDGSTWKEYTIGETEISLQKDEKVRFIANGTNTTFFEKDDYFVYFESSGKVAASGNIMSLLDATCQQTSVPDYAFSYLFFDCGNLTTAPQLPATIVGNYAYKGMFVSCTSLTTPPDLPATELGNYSYSGMFCYCTGLTQTPELPVTELKTGCYTQMFRGCTSLTQAPNLPATEMEESCYVQMFQDCTSLTQAPTLPATELKECCYSQMFQGCTSLTQAPELPATKLDKQCYNQMFYGCTSLTQAPNLPATELKDSCYAQMFYGCTSLTQAPELSATKLEKYCYSEMFRGCTSLTQAPNLPATELKEYCYYLMFQDCTSLTQAPNLPATELKKCCYVGMFHECKKLNSVTVGFSEWKDSEDATYYWLFDVASTGTFNCPDDLETKTGASYIPYGWTVSNTPTVTLNSAGFATYSSAYSVKVATENVSVYTASVSDGKIRLNKHSNTLGSDSGYILYGTPGTNVAFTKTDNATSDANDLHPTTTSTVALVARADADKEGTVWVLGDGNQFFKYKAGLELTPNRAYIVTNGSSSSKMTMVFDDDDIVSGISQAEDEKSETQDTSCYNLVGQKVGNNAKGLIIKNGKKYIVR